MGEVGSEVLQWERRILGLFVFPNIGHVLLCCWWLGVRLTFGVGSENKNAGKQCCVASRDPRKRDRKEVTVGT